MLTIKSTPKIKGFTRSEGCEGMQLVEMGIPARYLWDVLEARSLQEFVLNNFLSKDNY